MELRALLLPALLGVALAPTIGLALRRFARRRELMLWAWGLIGAALIYVGFAIARGRGLQAEVAGAVGFAGLGLVAFTRGARALGAAWILHALWDVPVHTSLAPGLAPAFYPPFCAAFDIAAGLWLVALARSPAKR